MTGRNDMTFVPAALEKDTCHLGEGLRTLLTRMTSARDGEEFEASDMPEQRNDNQFKYY